MRTLFISDLHLSPERPDIIQLFLDFMKERVADSDELYILGDLFEVWIGDDYYPPELEPVVIALRHYTDSGKPLYIIRGNRDFLMGDVFEKLTGCKLLPDPSVINLQGQQTLISHGDELCVDDVEYMEFRKLVRNEAWQKEFLAKPVEERIEFAKKARAESSTKTQQKDMDIMDVNQQAVENLMLDHKIELLIHGHTHRPNTHHFTSNEKSANKKLLTRIVLGDWYEHGSVLTCIDQDCELQTIQ